MSCKLTVVSIPKRKALVIRTLGNRLDSPSPAESVVSANMSCDGFVVQIKHNTLRLVMGFDESSEATGHALRL